MGGCEWICRLLRRVLATASDLEENGPAVFQVGAIQRSFLCTKEIEPLLERNPGRHPIYLGTVVSRATHPPRRKHEDSQETRPELFSDCGHRALHSQIVSRCHCCYDITHA